MNHAIKLGRFSSQSSSIFSSSTLNSSVLSRGSKGVFDNNNNNYNNSVRFIQVTSGNNPKAPNIANMDVSKNADQKDKKLNVMEESFGEGYSTRSDEEGFGGTYGDNNEDNAEMKIVQDPAHHDSSQGSEVKEKEKGRNTKAQ